jgi:hypothetical protein
MVSNAFLKSRKQTYSLFDDLNALSIKVFKVKIWSLVLHTFLNPICFLQIMLFLSKYFSNLLQRIMEKNLPRQLESTFIL